MKLKIPSSMRKKKRYVIFKAHSESSLDFFSVRNALWNAFLNWMGEYGLSNADITIYKNLYNPRNGTGFVRCDPKYADHVKMAMSLIHQIGDQRVVFQTLRVSGTIKSGKIKTGIAKIKT